jgi:protein gp37
MVRVGQLRPHPRNDGIYGDPRESQDFAAFVQDVKENGIHPLIVAEDMTIVGGHRRYYAALELGVAEVNAAIYRYESETDKLAALIADNNVRVKSNWQRANEADALMEIARDRAKRRQIRKSADFVVELFPQQTDNGKARDEVGAQLGVSGRTVGDMLFVKDEIDALAGAGETAEAERLKSALNQSVNGAAKVVRTKQRQQRSEPTEPTWFTVKQWGELSEDERARRLETSGNATFNSQDTDNIEWALWSWNPVTGCLHNCSYCYARDIANRFYAQKFEPSIVPGRLSAPANTRRPDLANVSDPVRRIGLRNVFVCSMADLFGKWVPAEWINAVLNQAWENPQWTFLFLTKFPVRMAEFEFPPNTWIGTTVDSQYAVERAESAFRKVRAGGYEGVAWLSCEPMMERLTFSSLDMFDWVVVGGSSRSSQTQEFRPPFEWIVHLWQQAKAHDLPVYMKTNLGIEQRVREYPTEQ